MLRWTGIECRLKRKQRAVHAEFPESGCSRDEVDELGAYQGEVSLDTDLVKALFILILPEEQLQDPAFVIAQVSRPRIYVFLASLFLEIVARNIIGYFAISESILLPIAVKPGKLIRFSIIDESKASFFCHKPFFIWSQCTGIGIVSDFSHTALLPEWFQLPPYR